MSEVYSGNGTYPASATLVEDGEVFNKTTAVDGMIKPLYDRTSYQKAKSDGAIVAWAVGSVSAGGVVTITDSEGIATITLASTTDLVVTFSSAFDSAAYALAGFGRQLAGPSPYAITKRDSPAPTSTVVRLAFYELFGAGEGNLLDITPSTGVRFEFTITGRAP